MARNFMSPPPIASFLNKNLPIVAKPQVTAAPIAIPKIELCKDIVKKLVEIPNIMPEIIRMSGTISSFMSINDIMISKENKTR